MNPMYPGGPSINLHWHVPIALHSLEGEIVAARKVVEIWEPFLRHRVTENKEHVYELGTATTAIILTSIIAERAIKSLIAQTQPNVKPWQLPGLKPREHHELSKLFGKLRPEQQQECQMQFQGLPASWLEYWEGDDIEDVFRIANSSFVDWRYTMEPKATTGGIPKGVLKAGVAVKKVLLDTLIRVAKQHRFDRTDGNKEVKNFRGESLMGERRAGKTRRQSKADPK